MESQNVYVKFVQYSLKYVSLFFIFRKNHYGINFTEEQKMIQQSARDYAQRELIKDVLERDAKAEYPTQHIKALDRLGLPRNACKHKVRWGGMIPSRMY